MLNIGDKARIQVYYDYKHIHTWNIAKKAKGKGQE
jgi:hypothetical protein